MSQSNQENTITIHQIPKQNLTASRLSALVSRSRTIRLCALKTNPECFLRTYEAEQSQLFDYFADRLKIESARTLIAVQHVFTGSDVPHVGCEDDDNILLNGKWVGMLTLLGPDVVNPVTFSNESSWARFSSSRPGVGHQSALERDDQSPTALKYLLSAMWVAPEARRRGVGAELIQTAMEEVGRALKGNNSAQKAIVTVEARRSNVSAQKLYGAMGFAEVAELEYAIENGTDVVNVMMRRDFER